MTDNNTNVSAAYFHAFALVDAAIETRDFWRTYALHLMANPPVGTGEADAVTADLFKDASCADEALEDIIANPEHYKAEQMRIWSASQTRIR